MFPRLKQQLLARADLLVELSTLGEYGIDQRGAVMALEPETAVRPTPRRRDRCADLPASGGCATARSRVAPARP